MKHHLIVSVSTVNMYNVVNKYLLANRMWYPCRSALSVLKRLLTVHFLFVWQISWVLCYKSALKVSDETCLFIVKGIKSGLVIIDIKSATLNIKATIWMSYTILSETNSEINRHLFTCKIYHYTLISFKMFP